nr:AMP-binding protein [Tessaracoccus coleopterorum]
MFEDHGARVVIAWDAAVAKLREQPSDIQLDAIVSVNLLKAFPTVKRLALTLLPVKKLRATKAKLTQPAPGTIPWEELLKADPINPAHPRPAVYDLAVIQYTSGTTGQPKGAMLTHSNLFSNARQGEAWMHGAQYRKEIFYAILPLFHAFGMTLFLTYGILKQARLVLFPSFDVNLVLDAAVKSPPTVYCAVPPIYEATARRAKERGISLRSAKYCISGAMALPASTVELWESVSGGLLVEGYGMTEASPVCLGNPFAESRRSGTIGVPFPSTWMRVVDPEDPTRDVEQGERGELLIHGPQVFQGYWHNEEETAKTLLPGGWLRTGDIVTQDEDGFTTIVDRVKELIITGGFNVAPSEVEAVLLTHPLCATPRWWACRTRRSAASASSRPSTPSPERTSRTWSCAPGARSG